ncbi:head GIN domain-containing protein [Sphingomonas sp.]|uniref:head GIN domain-containing protein n=1 Tax=Sphingomonas sp. TaxID=28214 RepID=UPI0035BC1AE6
MRRSIFAALTPIVLAACSIGGSGDADAQGPGAPASGSGNARTFAVADFDTVDLRGADDVDVRVGSGFSVRAEGPSDMLDQLRVTRDGKSLRIDRRGFHWGSGTVKVLVTMPQIAGAKVSGSGDVAIDRVEGERFDGAIAGSGGLAIAAMQVNAASLSIAGSGDVKAAGTARRLTVDIAGSGNVDAADLRSNGAKVSVAGSGNVRAGVTGDAQVDLAGSGDVDLGPGARCTTRSHGSGTVRCGGR